MGSGNPSPVHSLVLGIEIVLVCLCIWLSYRTTPFLANALGRTGINIVTRIMGLIMAAIGVEFIANGLRQLFPLLAGSG
jgi:multiple antibiotic resistance protein